MCWALWATQIRIFVTSGVAFGNWVLWLRIPRPPLIVIPENEPSTGQQGDTEENSTTRKEEREEKGGNKEAGTRYRPFLIDEEDEQEDEPEVVCTLQAEPILPNEVVWDAVVGQTALKNTMTNKRKRPDLYTQEHKKNEDA